MPARSVVTIGTFDGVHIGHAAILRRARGIAEQSGARVVALAFDPHPATVLRPDQVPARLTSFEHRARFLSAAGADEVLRLEPTPELLSRSPEAFIDRVVQDLAPLAFVEGSDFHFGKARAGNINTLQQLGQQHDFRVEIQDPVETCLTDCTIVRASSTLTRWLIEHGRVRDAAILLGREYDIGGTVVPGDRRGRQIGFPTANIQTDYLPPIDSVYAGSATLPDGRKFPAAISVGTKPTFGPHARAVEAFLIQAPRDGVAIEGLPEYGWPISLNFSHWLRDQARFESIPALLEQMDRDCQRALDLLNSPRSAPACP